MAIEWTRSSIGSLCDAGVAELQTGPFGSQLHSHDYVDAGVGVVPTEAIHDRRIDHSVLPHIPIEKANQLRRHQLKTGDILFARRGVQATGHIGVVRVAEEGYICGTGAIRLRITRSDGVVDSAFLSHVLADPASVEWFKFHAIGATMPNLNEGIIRSFPFLLPPLREQYAIAAILGALDDKIDLNRRMSETLEAVARALFKSWFVDFDPVRAKAEGRDPGLAKPIADLFPDRLVDSELGEIPAGWEVVSAGELFDVRIGKTPPRHESRWFSKDDADVRWMSIKDLGLASTYIGAVSERLTNEAVERFRIRRIPDDTVVVSFKLTVGRVAITDGEMVSNEAIAHFIPRRDTFLGPPYLLCYLRTFDYGRLGSTSSIATAVNSDSIRSIPVVVPSHSAHARFQHSVEPVFQRLKQLPRENLTLASLRDALLPKLISGEVRIKDAERIVGAAT